MSSSYRAKQKDRWRADGAPIRRQHLPKEKASEAAGVEGDGDPHEMDDDPQSRTAKAANAEDGPTAGAEDADPEDDVERIDVFEIDESWASPRPPAAEQATSAEQKSKFSKRAELVLKEGEEGLTDVGDAAATPTLPPPDVIVVSQPRDRKPGVGTKRHFHSWLRSTAARAIIYIATDMDAFTMDLERLMDLGYSLECVQPFDAEPHRRSLVYVARLELIRPLAGAGDYGEDGTALLQGHDGQLAAPAGAEIPMLGDGGYSSARALPASSRPRLR